MKITTNASLADYTSLKAGGPASTLIELGPGDDLTHIVQGHQASGPVWVLGYGTNCLISDRGLPGTVILNHSGTLSQLGPTKLKVSSGFGWDRLVQAAIQENLWGLEFMSGIPGGVGAAIAGNIAAYGQKVADTFIEATILDAESGKLETWGKPKMEFDYRTSSLQLSKNKNKIVLDAIFELSNDPTGELEYGSALKAAGDLKLAPDSLANRRKIIMEARRQADSLLDSTRQGPWTAGSFFRNPLVDEKQVEAIISHEEVSGKSKQQILDQNRIHGQDKTRVSASHVLLAAGFKRGQSWGNVRLDPEHVLKVENIGNATAQEIYDVVQNIIKTVHEKLNIKLEPEVRFLGEF